MMIKLSQDTSDENQIKQDARVSGQQDSGRFNLCTSQKSSVAVARLYASHEDSVAGASRGKSTKDPLRPLVCSKF